MNANTRPVTITFLNALKKINQPVGDLGNVPPPGACPYPIVVQCQIIALQSRMTTRWNGMAPEQLAKANSICCFVSLKNMLEARYREYESALEALSNGECWSLGDVCALSCSNG